METEKRITKLYVEPEIVGSAAIAAFVGLTAFLFFIGIMGFGLQFGAITALAFTWLLAAFLFIAAAVANRDNHATNRRQLGP